MYITKNDLKAIYILPLGSSKGRLHINYKYTLLAETKNTGVSFLQIDGAKKAKKVINHIFITIIKAAAKG